jgi:glycosyltransferase involved in cell wall biosynthesis
MVEVARRHKLRFIEAPTPKRIPSWRMLKAVVKVCEQERPDVVHVWDWWQYAQAFVPVCLYKRLPMVVSDMISEDVPRVLPKSVITTFGTPELVERWRCKGWKRASLLLPPVDISENTVVGGTGASFRAAWGISREETLLVTVSRLAGEFKAEGIRRAIRAVADLHPSMPLRYVIVGDGNAKGDLLALAAEVNAQLKRNAVLFTGEMLDPRPAYDAADLLVGMGGSALRGMAFSKPVIVVGAAGFCEVVDSNTWRRFLHQGLYGIGDGDTGGRRMRATVERLAGKPMERYEVGQFSRAFVAAHFSIGNVAEQLNDLFERAIDEPLRWRDAVFDGAYLVIRIWLRPILPKFVRSGIKQILMTAVHLFGLHFSLKQGRGLHVSQRETKSID